MADTSPPTLSTITDPAQYWCYQCDKRVPIETRPDHPDLICFECKNGFVESVSHARQPSHEDTPAFGDDFLQVLRLIAHAARDDDAPPPPPSDRHAGDTDYLRIELEDWNNDNEQEDHEQQQQSDDNDNDDNDEDEDEDEENDRREARDALRIRLRDFASRAASRRNRILDWAEILIGLEDQSMEVRNDSGYIGNPGDYVDEVEYENLLNNLAENDSSGRKAGPPAAKSVVEGLHTVDVKSSTDAELCAVCKDSVFNSEGKVVKQLECGHMYHGECIVPWLGERNTCPVCRYELPTDDPEYEEGRKKKLKSVTVIDTLTDNGCSSSSGGGGGGGD